MSSKASIVRGRAAVAAAPAEPEAAPKGRRGAASKAAPAPEPVAPKGRGKVAAAPEATERTPRGADRRYKLLVKDNPFREGSKRHAFWDVMKRCKTTGEVRLEEPLCTTAFFDSLAEREPAIIEYLD